MLFLNPFQRQVRAASVQPTFSSQSKGLTAAFTQPTRATLQTRPSQDQFQRSHPLVHFGASQESGAAIDSAAAGAPGGDDGDNRRPQKPTKKAKIQERAPASAIRKSKTKGYEDVDATEDTDKEIAKAKATGKKKAEWPREAKAAMDRLSQRKRRLKAEKAKVDQDYKDSGRKAKVNQDYKDSGRRAKVNQDYYQSEKAHNERVLDILQEQGYDLTTLSAEDLQKARQAVSRKKGSKRVTELVLAGRISKNTSSQTSSSVQGSETGGAGAALDSLHFYVPSPRNQDEANQMMAVARNWQDRPQPEQPHIWLREADSRYPTGWRKIKKFIDGSYGKEWITASRGPTPPPEPPIVPLHNTAYQDLDNPLAGEDIYGAEDAPPPRRVGLALEIDDDDGGATLNLPQPQNTVAPEPQTFPPPGFLDRPEHSSTPSRQPHRSNTPQPQSTHRASRKTSKTPAPRQSALQPPPRSKTTKPTSKQGYRPPTQQPTRSSAEHKGYWSDSGEYADYDGYKSRTLHNWHDTQGNVVAIDVHTGEEIRKS